VNPGSDRRGVLVYLLITFGLSSIFYFLIIKSGHLAAAGGAYVGGLMWCCSGSVGNKEGVLPLS
jgi:hypothetical protein